MCGIAGMASRLRNVERGEVEAMRDRLTHRGPDDAGVWVSSDRVVGLGHRRLSIIDLSERGHQPMTNEDGSIWLVFNGEIYNFQSLRDELLAAGHIFRSDTDSEVILHAYEEWGVESVRRLRGMFAYAIWDSGRRRLILARDRLGIKPLFYACTDDHLSFASELKAFKADRRLRLEIDETAIYDFFTYRYIPTPKTVYSAVRKLPPGYYAIYEDGKLATTQYWDMTFGRQQLAERDAIDQVREKLAECVRMHMISDVPVGVMLSGGLDSSTVSALAARAAPDAHLHTFSIGFDVAEHDETQFARLVADRYATDHHELQVTRRMAMDAERLVVDLYDEPFADSSAVPTYFVSKLAREHVKVVLSGEGGDELFFGYSWYQRLLKLNRADGWPTAARGMLGVAAGLMPEGTKGKWTLNALSLDPLERYAMLMSGLSPADKRSLLSPTFLRRFDGYDDYWHFRRYWREDFDPMSRMQYLDIKTYLNDDILTKVDRASMVVSLEARVPLLDHELMESTLALSSALRNPQGAQKHLLKQAATDLLPDAILNRQKKGFSGPLHEWFKANNLKDFEAIYDNHFVAEGVLNSESVTGMGAWPFIVLGRWLYHHA